MIYRLNLKANWTDKDNVHISWIDTYSLGQDFKGKLIISIIALGGFAFLFLSIASGGDNFFIKIVAYIGAVLACVLVSIPRPNAVTINSQFFKHRGRKIPIEQITRIDYSFKSQWTGNTPRQGEPDPTQIRVWIGDMSFHTISENMWQTQINHKIRHTLDEALQTIRKASVKEVQQEEHGKPDQSNDFGMPEY
jgi:hypothetical protein